MSRNRTLFISYKTTNLTIVSEKKNSEAVEEYMKEVKEVSCKVLEMITEGLGIEPRDSLSKMVRDEKSDSCLRLNHYPTAEEEAEKMVKLGFGEHTDPQIISVLRSNNTSGLQICMKDGSWVAVPPDHSSFFINVGDALQVPFYSFV